MVSLHCPSCSEDVECELTTFVKYGTEEGEAYFCPRCECKIMDKGEEEEFEE